MSSMIYLDTLTVNEFIGNISLYIYFPLIKYWHQLCRDLVLLPAFYVHSTDLLCGS